MSVGGIISSNYPAWNGAKTTQKKTGKNMPGTCFASQAASKAQAAKAQGPLVLHGKNDADEGESVVGSSVNAQTGVSIAVYKSRDFDASHPVYHVKVWDGDGKLTDRMVDISKIDPKNSDEVEMSAYAWHLSSSGQCPNAFMKFASARSYNQTSQDDYSAKSIFEKLNWVDIIRDFMQMQYDANNMKGYLDYKKLLDFLE